MSNVVEFVARTAIERQAREWLIRMDKEEPLTAGDVEALQEWMRRSVMHRDELKRICKFWRQANVLTELAVCLESNTQQRKNSRERWASTAAVAATAVLATVVLTWWHLQWADGKSNGNYQTAVGQQKSIALADGSSIRMNTNSEVQVAYGESSRAVHLLKGEALFSVTHDPKRPFEVFAADSVVRAVGTAFAVHIESSKVDVTVTKGVVELAEVSEQPRAAAAPHKRPENVSARTSLGRVKAGEMTSVNSGSDHIEVQQLAEPELQRKMAWQDGYLAFSGEPLSEVIEQVNRYSPVTLEIGDPKLASVAIGARFRIGDLDAVLDVLETNFGIRAHEMDGHRIRLESGSSH